MTRLGPYRLCLKLADGGMARVYLARLPGLAGIHRFVALKCIRPKLACDPAFVEMFLDEARIASQLQHANVCSVVDFDEHDGIYVLAMEYLRGKPLAKVRRRLMESDEPLDPDRHAALVARVIADASEGLHAAHELRDTAGDPLEVVHRDVSPDNIFLTYDGNVKIVDFGVAKAAHQRHKTQTGILKGKYAYLQPEVLCGKTPDRRADVWGLGVVMWELLTLRRLFTGETDVETLHAVSSMEIPKPSEVREGIPEELDAIVARALSRDPDERYSTARELGRALTAFLVRNEHAVGLAEVSEFMDDIFPGGRRCEQQLLELVEQMDQLDPGAPRDAEADTLVPIELVQDTEDSAPGPRSATALARIPQRINWRSPWVAAALAVLLCVGVAGAAVPMTDGAPRVEVAPAERGAVEEARPPDAPRVALPSSPAVPPSPVEDRAEAEPPPAEQRAELPIEGEQAIEVSARRDEADPGAVVLRIQVMPEDGADPGAATR